jgi:hypothetical protein
MSETRLKKAATAQSKQNALQRGYYVERTRILTIELSNMHF